MKKFLNFDTLVTPAFLKILYPTLTVLYMIKYFWVMCRAFFSFTWAGMYTGSLYLIYFLVIPFALRIVCEIILVLFRIYEHTHKLANPDTELKDVVNCLSELKKDRPQPAPQPQGQNVNYNQQQPNQYNPNPQPYGQTQPGYNQPQAGFNAQQQQAPYYQGQPQNFGAQPNQPVQPTQPASETPIHPNNSQQS